MLHTVDNYPGVVLSLGSNIGDRKNNLKNALIELEKISEVKLISSVYESEALLVNDQRNFYNMVVEINYLNTALDLLRDIKFIEKKLGRQKSIRYGPRLIDIVIIFFKGESVSLDELTIPHYDWRNRLFVIEPLSEIIDISELSYLDINDQKVEKKGNISYK